MYINVYIIYYHLINAKTSKHKCNLILLRKFICNKLTKLPLYCINAFNYWKYRGSLTMVKT